MSPAKKYALIQIIRIRYIAICERAEKAQCSIFDTTTQRRRKTLTANDLQAREFISVAFSPIDEKNHLITLVPPIP